MRVALDTTYARRAPFSGTAVYLAELQKALQRLGEIEIAPLANDRRRPPAGGGLGSLRNLGSDAWWTAARLPREARSAGATLVHHPLPARSPRAQVPQVITVHDLSFERLPDRFDRRYRLFAHSRHRAAARAADAVLCIRQPTAEDVRSLWGIPKGRIVVAPLGPGQELPRLQAGQPRHFLYVGDAEPRKNLGTLLAGYRLYRERSPRPLDLVLAGTADKRQAGIRIEPGPSKERLAELYRTAAALVHPSLYEGFGLTPLEAMSLGTPVLAARSPGITEVCADAVRYADPCDPQAFGTAMVELAANPALQSELSAKGKARAAQFSWLQCARAHAYAYSLALGG